MHTLYGRRTQRSAWPKTVFKHNKRENHNSNHHNYHKMLCIASPCIRSNQIRPYITATTTTTITIITIIATTTSIVIIIIMSEHYHHHHQASSQHQKPSKLGASKTICHPLNFSLIWVPAVHFTPHEASIREQRINNSHRPSILCLTSMTMF